MSGDAQPRKRKDKKKKKGDPVGLRTDQFLREKSGLRKPEDSVEEDFFVPLKHSTDEVIHLHKDITCGGNVVTRLIFFGLLATIGVMVGFILLEYRGSTDEETSSAVDSPWSVTFHDWVDIADTGHDHEDEHLIEEHDHGDQEHDTHEEDEHDDHEEELHNYEEDEVEKKENWLFYLLSFGSISDEGLENKATDDDDDGVSYGFFSWFQSSEKEQSADEEEETSSGSWFGFGAGKQDVEEENPEQEYTSSEVYKDEDHVGESDERSDEYNKDEEDEEETEEEEEEEMDEEEENEEENESEEIDNITRDAKEDYDKSEEVRHEIEEEEDENDLRDENNESGENNPESEEEENKSRNSNDEQENDSNEFIDDEENESEEKSDIENEEPEEEDEEPEVEDEKPENASLESDEDEKNEGNSYKDDDRSNLFYNDEKYEESNNFQKGMDEQDLKLDHKHGEDDNISNEEKEESESSAEELFPEAREALRREAEEMESKAEEINKEEFSEKIEENIDSDKETSDDDNNEETEGMALRFGVGVALVVVAHIVLVKKWNSWAGGDDEVVPSIESTAIPSKVHEPITETPVVSSVPIKTETAPKPPPQSDSEHKFADEAVIEEVSADEESPVEEGSPVEEEEEEEEEQEDEDLEIDQQKFRDLLAKYGQETPESSDVEHTDEDRVDYSEGDESPVDDEGVEHEVVSEDEAGSEDDLKEWTGIKKSDIQVETDSEEEEVEEESEDEPPPPPPQPSRKKGGQRDMDEDYANALITSEEDWAIKEELDRADEEFNYEKARTLYRALLFKHPDSPRARYGLARTFDQQAEQERNNVMLDLAITGYKDALEAPNIPDILFIQIASRLIDRLRFRGHHMKAVPVHNSLIQKFNTTPEYRTDLAITYLMVNRLEDARLVLKDLLRYWNRDPFALAHYGLILKLQGNIHGCIKYFEEGLQMAFKPFSDPRLYFHYGDALARIGRELDAMKVYDSAVALGLFRSRYQRSLYNVDKLAARPWWSHEETTYASFFKILENNWKRIRDEATEAFKLNGTFKDEAEGLRDKGNWKQFELFARGSKMKKNCEITPFTCSLIGSFEPAATCKRGQSKFSIMEAGTHVWPHCGPTNCRLRAHLGLIVPPGPKIRVANITRTWEEGKVIVFDDSFEHEVWHEGSSLRLVLIVDVWHPELTTKEKLSLSPI